MKDWPRDDLAPILAQEGVDRFMITGHSQGNHRFERGTVRGVVGNAWESARDVCYEWGFDPRRIETRNVVIWHAADDTPCPAEIGRWLAEMFRAKEDVRVEFRDDDVGFGHVTYSRGEFAEPRGSMVRALLDGCD